MYHPKLHYQVGNFASLKKDKIIQAQLH